MDNIRRARLCLPEEPLWCGAAESSSHMAESWAVLCLWVRAILWDLRRKEKKQPWGMSLALWGVPGEAWQRKVVWLKQLTDGRLSLMPQQVETLGRWIMGREESWGPMVHEGIGLWRETEGIWKVRGRWFWLSLWKWSSSSWVIRLL